MRVALAQINPTVGDLRGNRGRVEEAARKAEAAGARLVVFPELVLTGYPPMDLLERDGFVRDQLRELEALGAASRGIAIALGAVLPVTPRGSKHLANAAVLLRGGARVAEQAKTLLPTYDVFDENRYFVPAAERRVAPAGEDVPALGLTVCEDAWTEVMGYEVDPTGELARQGAALCVNVSASPFHVGKAAQRREMVSALAARHGVPVLFCNQVGGNDELVFDGASFAVDRGGRVVASLPHFETALEVFELESGGVQEPDPERVAQLEGGLVLGIRDYFRKQDLPPGAVIGLSGGVDSAVTAHLAVEALGREAVTGLAMPGPFSSSHSLEDALALGRTLGIAVRVADIRPIYEAYLAAFRALFGARDDYGLAQQNVQSRIRGALLMAASNAENRLVLATGNKSELSVGYCTLYGDTVGGLAVLGDVYKGDVYALARHANRERERIPARTIAKPPSAELAPDQLDSDDLPPYDVLDAVLRQAIEGERGAASLEPPPGATRETALGILRRLDRNEYKRRQSPLVLRVSTKAFGSGRRLPIVHRYPS
ncbi:MAG TPA: NAD+ synthase [Myxococcota bacterium]|nr:NAD+ synthase [Myxococcota bacterium]